MQLVDRRGNSRLILVALLIAIAGALPNWATSSVAAQDGAVAAAAFAPGARTVVADGPLNQRASAGTSGAVLQVLATGTLVDIISGPTAANGYDWYYAVANSIAGYVAGAFLGSTGGDFVVGDTVFVDSDNVNVRSGPGTGFSIIDLANYGTVGSVIAGPSDSDGYVWYKLQYNGSSIGWIAGDFLSPSSTPPPSDVFAVYSWIFVDDGPVNLRFGPGTEYSVATTLQRNEGVIVSDTPTFADGYTWYPVTTTNGFGGFAAGEYFSGGIFLDNYAIVADGPLNLRSGPSGVATILATMPNGASIYINRVEPEFANANTWFQVTYSGITGWAAGSYLGPA